MAEKVDDFDWGTTRNGRASKYPWDEWSDGNTYLAKEGKDYTCKTISFRDILREHSRREHIRVRTRAHTEGVIFQFFKDEEE